MANIAFKRISKRIIAFAFAIFLLANILSAFHAYKFTHYSKEGTRMDKMHLTIGEKIKTLFLGVDNPRPQNTIIPPYQFKTINLQSNVKIECWFIPSITQAKGNVLLFHGYTSNKSALIERADIFIRNGYNCLLVDFMGSGGSEGNLTTIGYKEAEEVKTCYEYIKSQNQLPTYLYGSSLGAVAIMKAIKDYNINPDAIIIECPFATMYKTVVARFHMLHVPPFPLAAFLVFWGGLENGFWGFSHNPVAYAKYIHCPTLLQYGEKDDRVGRDETDEIFSKLPCPKKLITYPLAGHDDYLRKYRDEWNKNVLAFLNAQ